MLSRARFAYSGTKSVPCRFSNVFDGGTFSSFSGCDINEFTICRICKSLNQGCNNICCTVIRFFGLTVNISLIYAINMIVIINKLIITKSIIIDAINIREHHYIPIA